MLASTPDARYGNDLTALMWAAGHDEGVGAAAVERCHRSSARARCVARRRRQSRPHRVDDRRSARLMPRPLDFFSSAAPTARSRTSEGKTALDLAANDEVKARLTEK